MPTAPSPSPVRTGAAPDPGSSARLYSRLLGFLRPHLGQFAPSVLFMVLFAGFNSLSVTMVKPFTDIVIRVDAPDTTAPDVPAPSGTDTDLGDPGLEAKSHGLVETAKRAQQWFGDQLRGRNRMETFTRFCVVLLLVILLKNIFRYAQSILSVGVEEKIIRDIRNRIFERYLELPMAYFTEAQTGHLVSRITNDVTLTRGAIGGVIAKGLRQSLLAVGYIAVAIWASWKLFLLTILIAPVCFFLIDRLGRLIRRYGRRSQEHMGELTSVLDETITGIRIVKAFGLEGDRRTRFGHANNLYRRMMTRLARVGSMAPPLTEVLGMAAGIAIIWYAGRAIIAGEGMDPGRFMVFIASLFGVMQPVRILSNVNVEIQTGLAAATRIFEILDVPDRVQESPSPRSVPDPIGRVAFETVDFGYRTDRAVLREVSLVAEPGQVIGLVGSSGAGKSTLIDLIPRFYDPTGGRITIGGVDLRELSLSGLRARIGYVSQDTILFHDTVRTNIEFGRPGARIEEIVAAARAANADPFIRELPEGYDTIIGDRGVKLSGGQRQRVAIARALLKDPPILLFDEATSALDTESEQQVQEAIDRLLKGRTTFVIAHRLSTIQRADQILVMEGGRIIERGTHDELLRRDGRYRYLHELQIREPEREALPGVSGGPAMGRDGDPT